MDLRIGPALVVACGLIGCGAPRHGPATHAISAITRTDHVQQDGTGGVNRVVVTESRLSDEHGREWTERSIVGIEPVLGGLPQIEAELFQEAQRKRTSGTAARR